MNRADVQKLKVLDLFSGIGGFSLGLERTGGFETAAFCEISPKCRHLLNHHWPEVPAYDDICTLSADRLRGDGVSVRAVCGGFPCQDLSFAGKGAGLAGERSGLWREYARLIRELGPELVFVENVAALLGRGLGDVLGDLAALGYGAWWDCIPASAVGAPHRRDRLWIVAYAGSLEHQGYGDAFRRAITEELSSAALAHSEGPAPYSSDDLRRREPDASGSCADVADAAGDRWDQRPADSRGRRRGGGAEQGAGSWGGSWWLSEPDVGRTLDGFSRWLDETAGGDEAHKVILAYANASEAGPREALRDLRDSIRAEDDRRASRGPLGVSPQAVLLTFLREHARRAEEGLASLASAPAPAAGVRGVRGAKGSSRPPLRSGRDEQRSGQPADPLQVVSQRLARDAEAAWVAYRWPDAWASQPWVPGWEDGIARVAHGVPARVDRLHGLGNAVVPEIPYRLGKAALRALEAVIQREAA